MLTSADISTGVGARSHAAAQQERLAPLENAPFSTPWARKRCSVAQRFRQYLRATNCYKLSELPLAHRVFWQK